VSEGAGAVGAFGENDKEKKSQRDQHRKCHLIDRKQCYTSLNVQALWRVEHLRAQPPKKRLQEILRHSQMLIFNNDPFFWKLTSE
jgi:hypothetical protein